MREVSQKAVVGAVGQTEIVIDAAPGEAVEPLGARLQHRRLDPAGGRQVLDVAPLRKYAASHHCCGLGEPGIMLASM